MLLCTEKTAKMARSTSVSGPDNLFDVNIGVMGLSEILHIMKLYGCVASYFEVFPLPSSAV